MQNKLIHEINIQSLIFDSHF